MPKFKICANEVVEYEITIEADSYKQAVDKAIYELTQNPQSYTVDQHGFQTTDIKEIDDDHN